MAAGSDFAICQRLMELASDPDNQAFILKEQGCMMGLVKYLDNPASEVVSMAARAIWLLSSSPGNTPSLMKQAGLFDKLCKLNGSTNEAVKYNVSKALANLNKGTVSSSSSAAAPTALTALDENARPAGDGDATLRGKAPMAGAGCAKPASSASCKPRTLTIKVDGLDTAAGRDGVIKALLKVVGVTSVTVDTKRGQAIVLTHKQEELRPQLMEALQKAQAECTAAGGRTPFKALDESLDYLDEDDDTVFGEGAIAQRTGRTSLEARLAEKRQKQQTHLRKRDMVKSALGRVFGGWW